MDDGAARREADFRGFEEVNQLFTYCFKSISIAEHLPAAIASVNSAETCG